MITRKQNKFKQRVNSILLIIGLTCVVSCQNKSNEDYIEEFKSNQPQFEQIIHLIEEKYVMSHCKEPRIMFLNCNEYKKTIPAEKCDEQIIEHMKELDIRSINFEREEPWCDTSKCFDKVYFMTSKRNYYPVVYYVYDYCNGKVNYETNTIFHKTIVDGWSLLVDSNYP